MALISGLGPAGLALRRKTFTGNVTAPIILAPRREARGGAFSENLPGARHVEAILVMLPDLLEVDSGDEVRAPEPRREVVHGDLVLPEVIGLQVRLIESEGLFDLPEALVLADELLILEEDAFLSCSLGLVLEGEPILTFYDHVTRELKEEAELTTDLLSGLNLIISDEIIWQENVAVEFMVLQLVTFGDTGIIPGAIRQQSLKFAFDFFGI